jgi:prefoldin subunit 5
MVRFGIVERKLDALDETAQEIRTNVETVQESLEEVRTRVQNIDANTQFSSSLLGKLLLPQAPKAAWWLSV